MGFALTNRSMIGTGAALGAALVFLSYPGGLGAAYRDAQAGAAAEVEAAPAQKIGSAEMMDRIALKEGMVSELVAGRARLVDIAARFQEMNADIPGTQAVLKTRYPGVSDAERSALNVIGYVEGHEMPAAARQAAIRRLAVEYRQAYGYEPAEQPAY